jgi:hypothetical protein
MRFQNSYVEHGQEFHDSVQVSNLRRRAWALLHNYRDWRSRTRKLNNNARRSSERLNKKRYAENWLEHLLIATSHQPPQNAKQTGLFPIFLNPQSP